MTSIKKEIMEFRKEFLEHSYCGNYECQYEGKDKCFHGSQDAFESFLSQALTRIEEETRQEERERIVKIIGEGCNPEKDTVAEAALREWFRDEIQLSPSEEKEPSRATPRNGQEEKECEACTSGMIAKDHTYGTKQHPSEEKEELCNCRGNLNATDPTKPKCPSCGKGNPAYYQSPKKEKRNIWQ